MVKVINRSDNEPTHFVRFINMHMRGFHSHFIYFTIFTPLEITLPILFTDEGLLIFSHLDAKRMVAIVWIPQALKYLMINIPMFVM